MKLHYKMFSVSIAFALNMKTYCNTQGISLSFSLSFLPVPLFFCILWFPKNLPWILYGNIFSSLRSWF